jgi:hypothetical protein
MWPLSCSRPLHGLQILQLFIPAFIRPLLRTDEPTFCAKPGQAKPAPAPALAQSILGSLQAARNHVLNDLASFPRLRCANAGAGERFACLPSQPERQLQYRVFTRSLLLPVLIDLACEPVATASGSDRSTVRQLVYQSVCVEDFPQHFQHRPHVDRN